MLDADRTDLGRLFQAIGPAVANACWPKLVRVLGTIRSPIVAERRRRRASFVLTWFTNSDTSNSIDLQHQLEIILNWSKTWQLPISFSKCTILHLGQRKQQHQYEFQDSPISQSNTVRDLGILIDPKLNFISHIHSIVSRSKIRSSQIIRCFLSRNIPLMAIAFTTFVRPTLEYASTTWSPSKITQILFLEKVQQNFTKRLSGLKNMRTLNVLKLSIFKVRASSPHQWLNWNIQNYYQFVFIKIWWFLLSSLVRLNARSLFSFSSPLRCNKRQETFFSCRVVPVWNALPDTIVSAKSISSFKRHIRSVDLGKFLIFPTVYS